MSRLAIDRAPAVALPRRFLLSAPPWGMLAGVLLAVDADRLLQSRWQPGTLALVHVFTLGVLGNAMFGSVLQFLPAAAGVRLRGLRWGGVLHGLLNLGSAFLVAGLHAGWRGGLVTAGVLLPAAFVLLAAMTLPGVWEAGMQRLLRAGLAAALGFALLAALLGGGLVLALGGVLAWPVALPTLADVHAGWGLLGWIVLLLASVAPVVMPMFQGTAAPPAKLQASWLAGAVAALLGGAWLHLWRGEAAVLRMAPAALAGTFAAASLWLQWRAPRPRRGPLWWSWRGGLLALLAAALAWLFDPGSALRAAALALLVALPWLVNGMALEIVAFLGWIELHRRVGRGVQLPGVQRLLPERDKWRVLHAQWLAAALLFAAVMLSGRGGPAAWLARAAGAGQLLAWWLLWRALRGVRRRSHRFLSNLESFR
ncbi:hypothetical protein ASG87_05925 [Frateuria sp. Soil773]|uniref:hypothetical protein n=1 Tax=Frateuria sp. Soil773 TaxID=1736407 RepID=UPI0006FCB055|nr:hypothetical protein [Frateuria sp. Soil773]KRE89080.1 hypothetical protein ASG87_05925 [Frateuria sp. Soil773]